MKIFDKRWFNETEIKELTLCYKKLISNSIENGKSKNIFSIEIEKSIDYICIIIACLELKQVFLPLNNQDNRSENIAKKNAHFRIKEKLKIEFNKENTKEDFEEIKECGYLIFSSGSTGEPKGILCKTESMLKVVEQQINFIKEKKGSFAWVLNPAFDASLSDLFISIKLNLNIVIPLYKITDRRIINFFNEYEITHSDIPPSILCLYKSESFKTLKTVIIGGESIPNKVKINGWENTDLFQLIQSYGPTECHVSTSFSDNLEDIGKPFEQFQYKIIERELYIGGDIAIGYFKNKKLTENKFVLIDNVIFFKTGDIVDKIEDRYYYKGRSDRQIKWRGNLIAPEEIEKISEGLFVIENNKKVFYHIEDIDIVLDKMNTLPKYMRPSIYKKIENLSFNINYKKSF